MDKNKYDYLIVGAGISGVVIAQCLASINKKVLIIEKRKVVGGNCYDYFTKEGVLVSKYGPHIFRTDNIKVWNYIKNFSEWNKYIHKVLVKIGKDYFPFPININTINSYLKINLKNENDALQWIKSNSINKNTNNFEEEAINIFGKDIYNKFIYSYTKKQWGVEPREIGKEILKRIPIRLNKNNDFCESKYQYQPKFGFTKVIEEMLNSKNIDIMCNEDFIEKYDKYKNFDNIIYTGKLDDLYNKIFNENEKLKYRSLKFKYKKVDSKNKLVSPVVNFPDEIHKYTRVADYGYLFEQKVDKTVLKYEYPSNIGVECYPFVDSENQMKADILKKRILNNNKNIHLLGRLATYKYIDMDKAVEEALDFFDEVKVDLK